MADTATVETPVADPLGDLSLDAYASLKDGTQTLADLQKPKPEAPEPEPELPEAAAKTATEILATEADPEARVQDPETALGNKRGKLHKRIGQILQGETHAKEQLATEKARADRLEEELRALKNAPPAAPRTEPVIAPKPIAVLPAAKDDPEPNQDDYDGSEGKTYEHFLHAHTRWAVRDEHRSIDAKRLVEETAAQARVAEQTAARAHESAVAAHQARTEAIRQVHADYDATVTAPDLPFTEAMRDLFITVDDDGPKVAYHLAKTPQGRAELTRLSQLTVGQMLVGLGAIKASLKTPTPPAAASSGPVPAADPVTQHTPPIEPVGSGLSASATGIDPGDLDLENYSKRRDQEWAAKRKR